MLWLPSEPRGDLAEGGRLETLVLVLALALIYKTS